MPDYYGFTISHAKMAIENIDSKNTKRILLVSNGFYPEISPRSFRATELAKEFCKRDYDVTVISKYRDHDYSDFLKTFTLDLKMWRRPRFPVIPELKGRFINIITRAASRLLLILFEYPGIEEMFLVRRMLKIESGYDMMISFAVPYPVHWGVAWARTADHPIAKSWFADCGDPYMFNRLDSFRKAFYFKYLEKNFCRKCDFLTVPNESMRTKFYPEFHSKINIIPQGFNYDDISLYEGELNNNKPVFIFAGSVIPGKRDLKSFLEFLSGLSKDFLFIVYTKQAWWFEPYKENLDDKLEIRKYISRLSLIYEMSKADFLVNVDTIHDIYSNVEAVPSKLIDYALSGRPIMNIRSDYLNKEMVMEFLDKNYSRQRVVDLSTNDIRKVVRRFTELSEKSEA